MCHIVRARLHHAINANSLDLKLNRRTKHRQAPANENPELGICRITGLIWHI